MILVTGASGQIGRRVAALLRASGKAVRLMARNPATLPEDGFERVAADYSDPDALDRAFAGIDAALLVSGYAPPGERARLHANAIDAARRSGVSFLVYTSFQGASPSSRFPMSRDHAQTEELLERSGIPFTALRDSFYLDLLPDMFDDRGVVRGPAGDGVVAWVARSDVARTAATILSGTDRKSGVFDVTGPEAISLAEAAASISALIDRQLRYVDESVEDGRAWRAATGAPAWEVDTWLGSYEAIAAGEVASVSPTVEHITGSPPESLQQYFSANPALLSRLRAAP
jgi:uncharacterized protein YbjT (DUF2867 family)